MYKSSDTMRHYGQKQFDLKMVNAFFVVFGISWAVVTTAMCHQTDWSLDGNISKEELKELEILKQLTIEELKAKILRKLGKTKIPPFTNSSRKLPKHVIQMWKESEPLPSPTEPQENLVKLVIFPKNRKFLCHWDGSPSCRRFEYSVSADVLRSPSELSVYHLGNYSENVSISVYFSKLRQQTEKSVEKNKFVVEGHKDEWLSFQLQTFEKIKFWRKNVTFAVEIAGLPLDDVEPNLPFLKMKKDMNPRTRKRKAEKNSTRNRGCQIVPFNISFHDIGYGHWIEYPDIFQANMCKGYCQHVKNHHEHFMDLVFQKNKTLEIEYGRCWSTCCRPTKFDTLDMIYRDSNDTFVQAKMIDMIVMGCSCT